MHIELVLLILSILCMVSTSAITTSCIGLVPNGLWFNRPSDSFPVQRVPTDCLPLCNPPPADTAITDNCYPICNPSASPTPIIINCRTLPQCSASITTNCMCNGGNMPTGCYYPTQTMPTSCNPSTCVNAAEYQYDDYMVMISGLIRYEAGNGWMGSKGNGLIATFGNQAQCPSRPEIFTATNGWGLDCTVEILWNTTSNACEIYLLSWSLPMAYYYTGANPATQTGYYVSNNAQLWLNGGNPTKCECGGSNSDCVKVIIGGQPGCRNVFDMNFVSLDGISYIYTPPASSPPSPPSSGAITLATTIVRSQSVAVWKNAVLPPPSGATINSAKFVYDGFAVTLSGLIEYVDTAVSGAVLMGEILNGYVGSISNHEGLCPNNAETFKVTNGFGVDCTIEILWNATSNACEIYLLSWNIPMLYYYTGAYKNYPFHGTPVTQAFYVVNSLRFLEIGPAIEECKCTDPPTDHCAKIYVNGATTPTCLEPRNTRFVSLDGIVYVPRNNPVQTSSRVGSIQFATRQSSNQKVWDNAKRNERIINQATYHYNGNMVSLSGLLNYTGTGVMGSELQGNIGYIDNAQVCPSNQEIFAVSNGRGVDCSVQIEPATANTCPIDLLAWSIPVAVYYTGAVSGFTQSFYVADNVELMKASTGATNCACGKPNPTRNECFRIWVGNNEPACLPGDKLSLVSLDDIQFTSATIDGTPSYGTGDPHFTLWDGSRHHLQGRARLKPQFYYIISCDIRNKALLPYTMIGKHININSRSKISRLHYVTLELFDNNNNNYLVFLSSSLRHYTIETDGVSSLYETNVKNGVSLTTLPIGQSINIGDRFVILIKKPNSRQIDVTLTIDEECQLKFTMKRSYLRVMPPNCYRENICGLLGDFKKRGYRSQKLPQCNGGVMNIKNTMRWNKIYDPNGWSWEKTYVDALCGGYYEESDDDNEEEECDESIRSEVIATCQKVRDDQKACCNSIGGDFCDNLQTWCEFDACVQSEGNADLIAQNVYDLFTEEVVETCQDCSGCFGPIPKLLYEFDGNLEETQSNGDSKYNLQIAGDAFVGNGVLNCDGSGDYAYNEYNLDLSMTSHSLEVLVSLDSLDNIGGGTISIDSTYTSNEPDSGYAHNKFDSIVYNEINDTRWFAGSEYFSRTLRGVGTQESVIQEYIHLVASYDVGNNKVKLYRNGVIQQDYTPPGFFEIDPSDGYRIMFCQRHLDAGGADFHGRIKFGTVYDYALSEEDVEILYDNIMVEVFGDEYEVIGDDLLPDKTLQTGQALRSTNKRYVAVLQRDGDFVVYDLSKDIKDEAVLFSTNTGDAVSDETRYVTYQSSDGNLVLYRNNPYSGDEYTSNILNNDGTGFLIIENDGSLVIYDGNDIVKWSTNPIEGGDGFIQFNTFRIGYVDDNHFSVSSVNNKKTSIIFRNDGRYFYGPRNDWGLGNKELLSKPINVDYTENGIEFGKFWCLGMSAYGHLSISHKTTGKTAMIWRNDGTRHGGPRGDFSCWKSAYVNKVSLNVGFIEFNNEFRIGYTGLNGNNQQHLSIASKRTCVIYRDDGTIHGGPRNGWAWSGWKAYASTSSANVANIEYLMDETSNYSKPYSYTIYHFIGVIILILLIINIICVGIYCKKKHNNNNNHKYNMVSLETTDVDTDTDSH